MLEFKNQLWIAFIGNNNELLICNQNAYNWVVPTQITGQTSKAAPSLVEFIDKIWVAFIAENGSNDIFLCSSADGITWSGTTQIKGQASKAGPSLAVFNGKLYISFIGNNSNEIFLCSSSDGISWAAEPKLNQSSFASPSLAVHAGKLWIAFIAENGSNQMFICSTGDGKSWSAAHPVNGQTTKTGPSLTECNNILYLAFISENGSNQILICSSLDGQFWLGYNPNGISLPIKKVKWAVVLCKPADDDSEVQSKQFFEDLYKGKVNGSLREYYYELTGGQIDLDCDVLGWFKLKAKKSDLTKIGIDGSPGAINNRFDNIYNACKDVSENYKIDFTQYGGVVVIFNYQLGDGGAEGIGQSNNLNLNGKQQNYSMILFDSAAWGKIDSNRKVLDKNAWSLTFNCHETGHGLGLNHSFAPNNVEYGNPYDIMSAMNVKSYNDSRQFLQSGPGLNIPNLITLNTMHPFNEVAFHSFQSEKSSNIIGNVELLPLNSGVSNTKFIRIINADKTFYTLEYRTKNKWDQGIDEDVLLLNYVDSNNRDILVNQCGKGGAIQQNNINIKFMPSDNYYASVEISGVYN